MSAALPAPLVPPEVDLSGYEFMPLFGDRLRASDTNGRATDAEFRAAVHLWWSAWKQIPAASLPNDDVILCKLADLGREIKAWRKVKAVAMAHFILCSDGRLYHPFLAGEALKAWNARVKAREKARIANEKRWGKKPSNGGAQPVDNTSPHDPTATANASQEESHGDKNASHKESPEESQEDRKGQDRTGQNYNNRFPGDGNISAPPPPAKAVPEDVKVNPAALARIVAEAARAGIVNPAEDPIVARWIRNGATPTQVVNACAEACQTYRAPKPMTSAYVDPIIERLMGEDRKARAVAEARVQATKDQVAEQATWHSTPMPDKLKPRKAAA